MGNALPTISGFVSPISADIADSHAATADCQADCQIASTSTRSVIRAGHSSPYCQRFEADNSHETELFSPLPNRDIALPVTDSHRPASHGLEPATPERQTRALIGGKGLFLHRMQQARIPVPPFTVVDTTLVAKLEQQPFPAQCLLPFLPDIHHWSHESRSLEQLRRIVTELPHPQQAQWLKGLSGFITSENFYQHVKNISAAGDIRHLYLALGQPSGEACIVRSSGVDEDRFGDAQAGRYDISPACFIFFCFPCL
ncbi:hypothetical protein [Endozoicomonas acroporae]|uniref:hypothetical protein n=1 Tax=Endozoicomonas acroporae TaxID=1701104 RepID=UPI003D7A6263